MRFIFVCTLILAIVLHIRGKPIEENESDLQLENWEAPAEIQKNIPYYLSGYDEKGRPIWIFEVGKYPLKTLLDQGPEIGAAMEKYLEQLKVRLIQSSTVKNPENDLQDIIIDFDGFDFQQFADTRTMAFFISLVQKFNLHEEDTGDNIVMVNASPAIKYLLGIAKGGFGQLFDKLVIFGTKKSEWAEKMLEIFPADQLPEWYGGSKDFKPVKVYG